MNINTKYLGKMDIDKSKVIQFESGLPGFLEEKEFVMLDIPDNTLLQILQSVATPELAFFVTNPHFFYQDYQFRLDEQVVDMLKIQDKKGIIILSILTIKDPFRLSTINLKAPLIINWPTKLGKQVILNDEKYDMKATITLPTTQGKGE